MTEPSTPLMRQYAAIKKEHPNALLFFRLGDFYELFFEDAVVAARELQITLTSRNKEKGIAIPMCGVPYHSAENYIAKLIRKGFKVAICEQMEDPRVAKKLVKREVTRVLTPGTAADAHLGSEENNFLACVARAGNAAGFAALDLSTGEFRATEFQGDDAERRDSRRAAGAASARGAVRVVAAAVRSAAHDCAAAAAAAPRMASLENASWAETPLEDWVFSPDYAIPQVENHFGVLSLEGFGLANRAAAATAAGAILHYVRTTQRGSLDHVDRIGFYERQNCLVLDAVTVRNLELIEPLFAGAGDSATLFRCLDCTVTPMGKRLLRAWMLRPSIDAAEISRRLDAVEGMVNDLVAREELRRSMEGILDLERLLSRVTLETANPRDLLALAASLARLPSVRSALVALPCRAPAGAARAVRRTRATCATRIVTSLEDEPPLTLADGGVIRAGVDAALDELRDLSRNSKQYIAQIEQRERQRTGIGSLKVKFNSVFGYYLEISKANLHLAPTDYERKQTLVNAERFTTPELKEYEAKVLDAQEKMVEIERRLFAELRSGIAAEARRIRQTALALAEIDVLASFATLAANRELLPAGARREQRHRDRRRPPSRHRADGDHRELDRFVPNDLFLNATTHSDPDHHRPEHGRQVHLPAAGGADRADGADGLVRSRALGAAGSGGPHLHPHRRSRQPGARPLDLHGRDDGDRRDPQHRDAALAHPARRGRTRHRDLRWPGHRVGGHRVHPRQHPRQDAVRHSLSRTDRIGRPAQRSEELPCVGEREWRRNCLSAQGGGRRRRQELRHRGRQAGRTACRRGPSRARSAGRARERRAQRRQASGA